MTDRNESSKTQDKFDIDSIISRDSYQRDAREARSAMRKTRQRRRRRVIAIATVAIALIVIAMYTLSMHSAVYEDEEGFEDFASQQFNKMQTLPDAKDRLVTCEYGDEISVAYRYDPSYNEDLVVFRDQQVQNLKDDFIREAKKELKKHKTPKQSELFHQGYHQAMLVDSAVYDSGTGALTMAIYTVRYRENENEMELYETSIDTYLLNKETLTALNPMQVMAPDYKDKASVYAREYLNKSYDEEMLSPKLEKNTAPTDGNYNQFVLSDGDLTVFFEEGKVVDSSEGVIAVTVPRVYMGNSIRSKVVSRYVDPSKPMVAITYDDGPGLKAERKILKCLEKYGAVATFFYIGNRIDLDEESVKKAYEIGCEIGNHSWDHSDLTGLSKKQIRSQVKRTDKAIKKVIGVSPALIRPPYGSYNDSVLEAVDKPAILWTVDTQDWSSRDAKKVFNVIKKTKKLDGKIILMHSIYGSTAKATEKIIPYLQKKGYQLVTVSELIRYKTGEAPKDGEVYTRVK